MKKTLILTLAIALALTPALAQADTRSPNGEISLDLPGNTKNATVIVPVKKGTTKFKVDLKLKKAPSKPKPVLNLLVVQPPAPKQVPAAALPPKPTQTGMDPTTKKALIWTGVGVGAAVAIGLITYGIVTAVKNKDSGGDMNQSTTVNFKGQPLVTF